MEDAVGGGPTTTSSVRARSRVARRTGNGATQGQLYGGFSEGFFMWLSR
jgi:hypothetical protein